MSTIKEYILLSEELANVERVISIKQDIMHDEVIGISKASKWFDVTTGKCQYEPVMADGTLTELWWAMLAGKNRLESHRATVIYHLNRIEKEAKDEIAFRIILAVANTYGIGVATLTSKVRKEPIPEARALIWLLLSEHTALTGAKIAELFNCNQSSVCQQRQKAQGWLDIGQKETVANYRIIQTELAVLIPHLNLLKTA